MKASPVRLALILLWVTSAVCCGGGGGNSPTAPQEITAATGTGEISPNPQTWTAQSLELQLPTYGPGFHPTKTLRVGGVLRTYYMRADNFIGFAESTDGITFTNGTATNIQRISTTDGDIRNGIDHPTVMQRTDGKFLMVYDYNTNGNVSFAKRLVARVSDDGITWGAGVLMPATSIDNSPGGGSPFQGVTGLVTMSDGSIRAYYTAGGAWVGSARTTDGGATWTEDGGYRLSPSIATGGFGDVGAIKDDDGSILLFVHYNFDFSCAQGAGSATGCATIRMARSTDGLNFKVYAGAILTPPSGPTEYQDPDVFIMPNGRWRMLFGDSNKGTNKMRVADRQ